jgi:glycosyltransferase involved in cell wall biosynthesis
MKLSIITINLNNAEGLQKTIESVYFQTFTDFEYIIIDGESADRSVDVIKQYVDKIAYWVSEPDAGIYHAMNKGIAKAHGEYLLFLNSGDWLYSNRILEEVIPVLGVEDIIYGDLQIVEIEKQWIKTYPDTLDALYFWHDSLPHSTGSFTRKDAFRDNSAHYDTSYKIVADWAWFTSGILKKNYSYRKIDKIIGCFEFGRGISSSPFNRKLLADERLRFWKTEFPKFLSFFEEYVRLKQENIRLEGIASVRPVRFYMKIKRLITDCLL